MDVTDHVGIDWSLVTQIEKSKLIIQTSTPSVTSSGLLVDSLGGIFDVSTQKYVRMRTRAYVHQRKQGPFNPSSLPNADFSSPLLIVLSDAILQNIGYIYWSAGLLTVHRNISTSFDSNTLTITVSANLTKTPTIAFESNGGALDATGIMGLELYGDSGEYRYEIAVQFKLIANADASFYPSVTFFNITELTLLSGTIP